MNTTSVSRRMTKRDYFTAIQNFATSGKFEYPVVKRIGNTEEFETVMVEISAEDMTAFAKHEIELLDRKNAVDKKPTKTQQANEGTKAAIKEYLDVHKDEKFTVSALMKAVPAIADASNQKVSALIRQMVADGQVQRIEDKRKAYFAAC